MLNHGVGDVHSLSGKESLAIEKFDRVLREARNGADPRAAWQGSKKISPIMTSLSIGNGAGAATDIENGEGWMAGCTAAVEEDVELKVDEESDEGKLLIHPRSSWPIGVVRVFFKEARLQSGLLLRGW